MAKHRRGPWSPAEDSFLLQLVHSQGAHNWVRISHLIASRSPKQCRERYHQNLKPTLNLDPITPDEGLLIERLVADMGKRWAEIARRLHGRSDNAVKNWWNGGMNRRKRHDSRQHPPQYSHTHSHSHSHSQSHEQQRPIPRPHLLDQPLASPSAVSCAGSIDSNIPPSLVSDHFYSPDNSPLTGQLPPLSALHYDYARPPLPTPYQDHVDAGPKSHPAPYPTLAPPLSIPPPLTTSTTSTSTPTSTTTPLQRPLPSFRTITAPEPRLSLPNQPSSPPRDARMNLSSVML